MQRQRKKKYNNAWWTKALARFPGDSLKDKYFYVREHYKKRSPWTVIGCTRVTFYTKGRELEIYSQGFIESKLSVCNYAEELRKFMETPEGEKVRRYNKRVLARHSTKR